MAPSPFVSRTGIALFSLLSAVVSAQTVPGGRLLVGGGAPGSAAYELVDLYDGSSDFFEKFNYYSSYDPTYGHVQYVNETIAVQNGYTKISEDGTAVLSVDTTNKWPRGGKGRPSHRIMSDNTYTHGLFVLDVVHMPYGCGVWPAYWLVGPNWPSHGEMDIIEGVNLQVDNSISLHSSDNCTIAGSGQTGMFQTSDCNQAVNGNSGCGTKLNSSVTPNNYGANLNDNGGGYYVTEWTSNYVKHWFFDRDNVPHSILDGEPNVAEFGIPAVNEQGSCNIDQHFGNHTIVINTDFCGAWAGWVYAQEASCPQTAGLNSLDSCVEFVGNNPDRFVDAYWEINSIAVYQIPAGVATTSAYSTSLSTVRPSASTNTINQGLGVSSSPIPSSAYTGPLSSQTTSKASSSSASSSMVSSTRSSGVASSSASSAAASSISALASSTSSAAASSSTQSSTPASSSSVPAYTGTPMPAASAVCPDNDQAVVVDALGIVYRIGCSSDTSYGSIRNAAARNGFKDCFALCDAQASYCASFVYVGGANGVGGGTCYFKGAAAAGGQIVFAPSDSTGKVGGIRLSPPDAVTSVASSMMASSSLAASSSPAAVSSSSSMMTSSSAAMTTNMMAVDSPSAVPPSSSAAMISSSSSSMMMMDSSTMSTSSSALADENGDPLPTITASSVDNYSTDVGVPVDAASSTLLAETTPMDMQPSEGTAVSTASMSTLVGDSTNIGIIVPSSASDATMSSMMASSTPTPGQPAPPCPTGDASLCSGSEVASSCSSEGGNTYDISCGVYYEGTVIDTSDIDETGGAVASSTMDSADAGAAATDTADGDTADGVSADDEPADGDPADGDSADSDPADSDPTNTDSTDTDDGFPSDDAGLDDSEDSSADVDGEDPDFTDNDGGISKRALEPTFAACQALCDRTAGCVALNYVDTNCTLLSSVTGTSYVQGAIGASVSAAGLPPAYTDTSSSLPFTSAAPSSTPSTSASPTCPGSAGTMYTDAAQVVYGIGCYTTFPGNDIGTPISASSFVECLPYCDSMSGCSGVLFNVASGLCYLKSSFNSVSGTDANIIYGLRDRAAPGGYTQTVTPSITSTLETGATITILPTTTLISFLPPGSTLPPGGTWTSAPSGTFYVSSSIPTPSGNIPVPDGGDACICYTCALTPTVVAGCTNGPAPDSGSGNTLSPPVSNIGAFPTTSGMCRPRPGTGTTTIEATTIITSCGVGGVCPASGYVIGGNATRSGFMTTTDKSGNSVIVPTSPTTSRAVSSLASGTGGGGGDGGGSVPPATTPGTGYNPLPTCPYADNTVFTSPMGNLYQVSCNVLFTNNVLQRTTTPSLATCISLCDMYNTMSFMVASPCMGVSWYSAQGADNCLIKTGYTGVYQEGVWSARLLTPYLGPGGGNGTGGGGNSTVTAPPQTITNGPGTGGAGSGPGTGPAPTSTLVVPSLVYSVSTAVSTYVSNGITQISTYVVSTAPPQTITNGNGPGTGPAPTSTLVIPSTIYSVSTAVSTYVSNGITQVSTYGVTTAVSVVYLPATTQTVTTTSERIVPSTVYSVSNAISTVVSNGITTVQTYGVTTALSVIYQTQTASTVTTTTVSISVSISDRVSTAQGATVTQNGPTITQAPGYVTITAGGGNYITVTGGGGGGTVTVISYVYPSSTSKSFTCRTYATNYLNGLHGRRNRRSVFDLDAPAVMDEYDRMPKPGAVPKV